MMAERKVFGLAALSDNERAGNLAVESAVESAARKGIARAASKASLTGDERAEMSAGEWVDSAVVTTVVSMVVQSDVERVGETADWREHASVAMTVVTLARLWAARWVAL